MRWVSIVVGARLAVVLALAVLAVGCSSGSGASGGAAEPAPVPDGAPAIASLGQELYQANCASCHGADLRGTDQGPPHLDPLYAPSHHPDEAFLAAPRIGVAPHHWDFGAMPRIEGLDDEELLAIVAYVRAVQRAEGLE